MPIKIEMFHVFHSQLFSTINLMSQPDNNLIDTLFRETIYVLAIHYNTHDYRLMLGRAVEILFALI